MHPIKIHDTPEHRLKGFYSAYLYASMLMSVIIAACSTNGKDTSVAVAACPASEIDTTKTISGIPKPVDLCHFRPDSDSSEILYHQDESKSINITIEEVRGMYVYYPNFKQVDLVCGQMPSPDDKSILMCCEAAFTGKLLNEFRHSNIAGNHVSSGTYYNGYSCEANTGCFAYYADTQSWDFAMGDYNTQLRLAEQHKGCGFGQVMLIHNNQRQPKDAQKKGSCNYYRVLAELNEKLCIIDSKEIMNYNDFVNVLLAIGVKHALYLDMGPGWNYSYYRDNEGEVKFIHDQKIKYTTNWIVFNK